MATNRSPAGAMALGGGAQVICSFPAFATGAMAVQISSELGFGSVGLGAAIGLYHASAALGAVPFGRLVDRVGAPWAIRAAALGAICCTLGIALLATNWYVLSFFLMVSGFSRAIAAPGANRLLLSRIAPGRLATAFGVKQSAPPVAAMLAGLSVPGLALTFGWRWAYVCGFLVALLVLLGIRGQTKSVGKAQRRSAPQALRDRPTVLLLAVAFGLSLGVAAIVTSFYVESSVRAGTPEGNAGWMLAAASAAAVTTRLVAGVVCDRVRLEPLGLSAALVGIGAVGLFLLASGQPNLMAVGVMLGMGGSWGFAGVFWFALIRAYDDMPGRITGALTPSAAGGAAGPIIFGMLAEYQTYTAGWYFTGSLALVGSLMLLIGSRRIRLYGPKPSN